MIFAHASLRLRNMKNKLENKMESAGIKKSPMGILLEALGQQEENLNKIQDFLESKLKEWTLTELLTRMKEPLSAGTVSENYSVDPNIFNWQSKCIFHSVCFFFLLWNEIIVLTIRVFYNVCLHLRSIVRECNSKRLPKISRRPLGKCVICALFISACHMCIFKVIVYFSPKIY